MARIDVKTRKEYTDRNIPIGRISAMENERGRFKILEQNSSHPEDSWYNNRYIGSAWAVFKYVPEAHFWQQISKWYFNFGSAQRFMFKKC